MDDVQVGSVIRAVRIRRGLRQSDVASTAGVSPALVSSIERGLFEATSVRAVRRVGAAVGVSLPFAPRWRGSELARLLDARHAAMVREVVTRLTGLGWQAMPEHTFSIYGEHGSIDVFARHRASGAVLVVEVKTRIVDLQDLLATLDRKRRLAPRLARELGWRPDVVGAVVAVPVETQIRHAIAAHRAVFDAACPADTRAVRRWLNRPEHPLRGVWFVLNFSHGSAKRGPGASIRVRPRRATPTVSPPRLVRGAKGAPAPEKGARHDPVRA